VSSKLFKRLILWFFLRPLLKLFDFFLKKFLEIFGLDCSDQLGFLVVIAFPRDSGVCERGGDKQGVLVVFERRKRRLHRLAEVFFVRRVEVNGES